jgi:uncharacterized phage-associated protein
MRYPSTCLAAAVQHLARHYKARLGIDIYLDHQKLQAVLFFMHAKELRKDGKSVFLDRPLVGEHGPIFRAIFDQLHSRGEASIADVFIDTPKANKRGRTPFRMPAFSDNYVWSLLEAALEDYGQLTTQQLMNLTQAPDGPWARARLQKLDVISDMVIVSCS